MDSPSILKLFQLQLYRISQLLKSEGGTHAPGPKKLNLSEVDQSTPNYQEDK